MRTSNFFQLKCLKINVSRFFVIYPKKMLLLNFLGLLMNKDGEKTKGQVTAENNHP